MNDDKTRRCRATIDGQRCEFRGNRAEIGEHANEAGHPRCIICARPLLDIERQTCSERAVINRDGDVEQRQPCAERVRDDLAAVALAYAYLHDHRRSAPHVLAVISDGSTQGGGQDDDIRYRDPCSAAAQLERNERDWREEFGHKGPEYPPLGAPRRPLHVFAEALPYLRTWHTLAARTHPGFDEYATEISELRCSLEHLVSLATDPVRAPIPCVCGGKLQQHFDPDTGLSDDRVCRACGTVYPPADYLWRYRMLTELQGWVSVDKAANETERTRDTVWAWVHSLEVPSACHRLSRRIVVDLDAVVERSELTPRQRRRRTA